MIFQWFIELKIHKMMHLWISMKLYTFDTAHKIKVLLKYVG